MNASQPSQALRTTIRAARAAVTAVALAGTALPTSALFSSVLAASPLAAQAQEPLDYPCRVHPAVAAPSQFPGVDPSTVIVGHPAIPTWRVVHAKHDHPAVVFKHDWATRAIDPNTFLVQPPAHVRWIVPGMVEEVAAVISPVEVPGS